MDEAEQRECIARLSQAHAAYIRACGLLSQEGVVPAEAMRLMQICLEVCSCPIFWFLVQSARTQSLLLSCPAVTFST